MGLKLIFVYLYFLLFQLLSLFLACFSKKWFIILARLELSIISTLPVLKFNNKSFTIFYFVWKVTGSVLIITGQLIIKPLLRVVGVFCKLRGFPFFWFPLKLRQKVKNWVFFWMLTFQKFPLYILWEEFFLVSGEYFVWIGLLTLVIARVYIISSVNLVEFFSWKRIIHSVSKVLIISYLGFFSFTIVFFIYRLCLFLFVLLKRVFMLKINWNSNSDLTSFFLLFSFISLPVFIKVIREFFLFSVIKEVWASFIILSIVFQAVHYLSLGTKFYNSNLTKKTNYFLFLVVVVLIILINVF